MHQLRLFATLIAVVFAAVSHFDSASAQTKLTVGYAAVSPRTTPWTEALPVPSPIGTSAMPALTAGLSGPGEAPRPDH